MARRPAKNTSRAPTAGDRVIVLAGKELLLRQEYTRVVREALEAAHGSIDQFRFDGNTGAAEVLDECRSFGLMASHKLVIVDEADQFVKDTTRPLLERYCAGPSEGATLLLRGDTWRAGNLDKAIGEIGVIVDCKEVSPADAARWLGGRAERAHGVKIDRDAANALVERVGASLATLDTELAKLATNVGAGASGAQTITMREVGELVGLTREQELWGAQSALLSGDAGVAIGQIRAILDTNPKGAHVPLTYACSDLGRKLALASAGKRSGLGPGQVASALKLWGEARDLLPGAAGRMDAGEARALFDAASEADVAQKSGLGRPARTLEALAGRFTTALSAQNARPGRPPRR